MSSAPICRVCGKPMVCLDDEAQRWYCYNDDEAFYAREGRSDERRLVDPILIQVGREPTKQELIRYYVTWNTCYSIFALIYLTLFFHLVRFSIFFTVFSAIAPVVAAVVAVSSAFLISKRSGGKGRIDWSHRPLWDAFRKPRDRRLITLFPWQVLNFVIIVTPAAVELVGSH